MIVKDISFVGVNIHSVKSEYSLRWFFIWWSKYII